MIAKVSEQTALIPAYIVMINQLKHRISTTPTSDTKQLERDSRQLARKLTRLEELTGVNNHE